MPWKKNNPGCPCCDSCPIPITGWTTKAGIWTTTATQVATSSANGLIVTANEHPESLSSHYLAATIDSDEAGAIARLIVAYDDDATDYLYGEIELGEAGASPGYLRLYRVDGGVATQLGEPVEVDNMVESRVYSAYLCYQPDGQLRFVVLQNDSPAIQATHYASATGFTGTRIGLATGNNAEQVTFDSIDWQIHYSDDHLTCPICSFNLGDICTGCDEGVPAYLKLVLSGITGTHIDTDDCLLWNGTYILPWTQAVAGATCIWSWTFLTGVMVGCARGGSVLIRVRITSVSVEVILDYTTDTRSYTLSLADILTCPQILDLDISSASGDGCCTFSSGKATISAIV